MIPKYFKEATIELKKPSNMTDEECSSLWVYQTDGQCISCWKTTFWERVKFLFHGTIWISVLSGQSQPPIWLRCDKAIFDDVCKCSPKSYCTCGNRNENVN